MTDLRGGNGDEEAADNQTGPEEETQRPPAPAPKPDSTAPNRAPDPPNWVEKWTFGVLIATFFAACWAGYEAARLATDTETAIAKADQTSELQHLDAMDALSQSRIATQIASASLVVGERAWIAPIGPTFVKPAATNSPVAVTLNYQNTGHSPATDVTIIQRMRFVPTYHTANTIGVVPPAYPECDVLKPGYGGQVVFPSTTPIYSTGIPASAKFVYRDTLEKKTEMLVWQGCFSYRTFVLPHKTRFCLWLRPEDGVPIANWVWNFCGTGNKAD